MGFRPHDELAHLQLVGVPEGRRRGRVPAGTEDGEVGKGVGADHVHRRLGAVREGGGPASGPGDDMGVGQENPSSVKTTADPAPSRRWPLRELPCTRSAATCGVSFAAIAVTTREYASSAVDPSELAVSPLPSGRTAIPASCLHDYCPTPAGGTLCR